MEQIADISELCRVCLDSQARELIPFNKKLYYTHHSIIEIIHFCTGVMYDDSEEENILPKHLCKPCLQQMKTAFELKTKCIESDKYLSSILCSTAPIIQPELVGIGIDEPSNAIEYYDDSMANTEDNESSDQQSNDMVTLEDIIKHPKLIKNTNYKSTRQKPRNMKNSKITTCNICKRQFTYSKSYVRHMKQHEEDDNSFADSARDSYQARSRSPSLEIVPEFDAISVVYKITPDSSSSDDDDDYVANTSTSKKFKSKPAKPVQWCNICQQTFTTAYYLNKHKRRFHPGL